MTLRKHLPVRHQLPSEQDRDPYIFRSASQHVPAALLLPDKLAPSTPKTLQHLQFGAQQNILDIRSKKHAQKLYLDCNTRKSGCKQ